MKDRITLMKLEQPCHVSESSYGLVLSREQSGYWLIKQTAYARSGRSTEYSECSFHIEKSFMKRAGLENLGRKIRQLTGLVWRYADCPDKTALISLIGSENTY